MEEEKKGVEIAPLSPGWIKKTVPASYADDDLYRIVLFYVINTPCTDLSSSGLPLSSYGWGKEVWTKPTLKAKLFEVAGLEPKKTFFVAKKLNEMKSLCQAANMKKDFHKCREQEKIAIYKPSKYNEFMAILYHIRNALAHGRLAMYEIKGKQDIFFALEDGVKKGDKFQVRSRMLLKKSTLIRWINILEKKENINVDR